MRKKLIPQVGFGKEQDIVIDNVQNTTQDREQDSKELTKQYTTQYTEKVTTKLTMQAPSKGEPFSKRLVANVTPTQKLFVQKMSKKFENESAFVRFMLDQFMGVELKGDK